MNEFQNQIVVICWKSTIILGMVAAAIHFFGRRRPVGCTIWQRATLLSLFVLPFMMSGLPTIKIPILAARISKIPATVRSGTPQESQTKFPLSKAEVLQDFSDVLQPLPIQELPIQRVPQTTISELLPGRSTTRPSLSLATISTVVYFAVAMTFMVRLIGGWRGLTRLYESSSPINDADWCERLKRWSEKIQLGHRVELRESHLVSVPMTFGWRRPIILVPHMLVEASDQIQRDAILVHELSHIVRADFFWQIMNHLNASLYWFHPLTWFVRHQEAILRERICDSVCVQQLGNANYMTALLQISAASISCREIGLGMAMARQSSLRYRLSELDNDHEQTVLRSGHASNVMVCVSAFGTLGLVVFAVLTTPTTKAHAPRAATVSSLSTEPQGRNESPPSSEATLMNTSLPEQWERVLQGSQGTTFQGATAVLDPSPGDNDFKFGTRFAQKVRADFVTKVTTDGFGSNTTATNVILASDDDLHQPGLANGSDVQFSNGLNVKFSVVEPLIGTGEYSLERSTVLAKATLKRAPKNTWADWKDDQAEFDAQVAAVVNGEPILKGEVISRYSGYLISTRESARAEAKKAGETFDSRHSAITVEQYVAFRESMVQRDIALYIQKQLLAQHLLSGISGNELAEISSRLDVLFEREIERLKRELNVQTMEELELQFKVKGTTLERVKKNFSVDRLAQECIALKSDPATPIEDREIQEYYQANEVTFKVPLTVDWQQILIPKSAVAIDAAREKLSSLLMEMNAGNSFDKLSMKYKRESDLFFYSMNGTNVANLVDRELEMQLVSNSLNQWSQLIEDKESYFVVRVTARQESYLKSLDDVREEIREKLASESSKKRLESLFRKVFSTAKIETSYTLPKFHSGE